MLKSAWNTLRPGDKVLFHLPGAAELVSGVVAIVDTRHVGNGVGVRVTGDDGATAMRWPPMKYVHRDPRDQADDCPRCAAAPVTAAPVTAVGPVRLMIAREDPIEGPPLPRICGRCRSWWTGDSTLSQVGPPQWYLCPECRGALLDDHPSIGVASAVLRNGRP